MDEEEALERLEELQDEEDIFRAHLHADYIIMEFLQNLGYNEIVDMWKKVDKSYG